MKKYFVAFFLTITLIPSVALASWWNPISWFNNEQPDKPSVIVSSSTSDISISNESVKNTTSFKWWNPVSWIKRDDKKNQQPQKNTTEIKKEQATSTSELSEVEKLRKEVDELKKQQNPNSSLKENISSPSTIKKTQVENRIDSENKTTETKKQPEENFSTNVATVYLSQAKSYQDLADFANEAIQYLDGNIDELSTLIAQHEGYKSALNGEAPISDAYISDYRADISKTSQYKNALIAQRDTANKNVSLYKKSAIDVVSKVVTREEFISTGQFLQTNTVWEQSKNNIFEIYNKYTAYRKDRDNYYVKVDAQFRALSLTMTKNNQTSTPVYQPQTVPQLPVIQFPKTTNCTLRGDGAGLQAYVNCISY